MGFGDGEEEWILVMVKVGEVAEQQRWWMHCRSGGGLVVVQTIEEEELRSWSLGIYISVEIRFYIFSFMSVFN